MDEPLEKHYDLKDLEIESIDFGDRIREEMGDVASLANDIMEHGVISPILVVDKRAVKEELSHDDLDPSSPYLLIAGERRTRASKMAGKEQIPAKVFKRPLTEREARTMELHENIHRKDMTPYEEAKAKEELHKLYTDQKGESTDSHSGGHTQEETAEMLGESKATVSLDLKIARWADDIPGLKEAETKSEARRMIREKKKEIAAEEKSKRVQEKQREEEEKGEIEVEGSDGRVKKYQKNLEKRYKIGDYFDLIEELPDGSIDILELDPDWGIDFIKKRASRNSLSKETSYRSIPPEAYEETFRQILQAALPKLKDHSWVLTWYSIEKWQRETFNILRDEGFNVCPMPGFWIKQTGNTATPAYRLGDSVAAFFYARKGSPRITEDKMGRGNDFQFRTLKKNERVHPAEKPVELYEEILRTFGTKGQVVVSGFAGSGNILLASENLGMNSVGFEKSEEWKGDFSVRVFNNEPGRYHSYDRGEGSYSQYT